jgi:glycosyltransferase involved in cell wall biosynthesis
MTLKNTDTYRPTRILQAINQLSRQGAEKFVVQLSCALAKQPNTEVKILITQDINDFADELLAANVGVVYIPAQIGPVQQSHIGELEHFLQDFRPDVIHAHILPVDALFTACSYRAQQYIFHIHSSKFTGYINPGFQLRQWRTRLGDYLLKRKVLKLARHVKTCFVTVSAYDLDIVRDYLPAAVDLIYLRNGITLPESPKALTENAPGSRVLISVGRLDKNKNQLFQLQVLRDLVQKDPRFNMVILGEGPELENLQAFVHAHQLTDHVHFSGSVAQVFTALEHADLFLHTAHSEALSLAIMEAIAIGLPVVMLNGNGNAELAASAGVSMLETAEVAVFADKILEICGNTTLYSQMHDENLQFAADFSMAAYALRWRAILENE